VKTTASTSDGKTTSVASTASTMLKPKDGEVLAFAIPITTVESISLGFRVDAFSLTDKDGNGASVSSTSGFGGASLIMEWKDGNVKRQAMVRMTDLVVEWVRTFDSDAAKRMEAAVQKFYKDDK
jgi:hypothetical protein